MTDFRNRSYKHSSARQPRTFLKVTEKCTTTVPQSQNGWLHTHPPGSLPCAKLFGGCCRIQWLKNLLKVKTWGEKCNTMFVWHRSLDIPSPAGETTWPRWMGVSCSACAEDAESPKAKARLGGLAMRGVWSSVSFLFVPMSCCISAANVFLRFSRIRSEGIPFIVWGSGGWTLVRFAPKRRITMDLQRRNTARAQRNDTEHANSYDSCTGPTKTTFDAFPNGTEFRTLPRRHRNEPTTSRPRARRTTRYHVGLVELRCAAENTGASAACPPHTAHQHPRDLASHKRRESAPHPVAPNQKSRRSFLGAAFHRPVQDRTTKAK